MNYGFEKWFASSASWLFHYKSGIIKLFYVRVTLLKFVFSTFELISVIKDLGGSINIINDSFFIKILRIFTRFNSFYSHRVKAANLLYIGNNGGSRFKITYIFGNNFFNYVFYRLSSAYITEINQILKRF